MNLAIGRRSLALVAALALSLAATGWLAAQESGVAEPAAAVTVRAQREPAAPVDDGVPGEAAVELRIDTLRRQGDERTVKELFAVRSWQRAPAASRPLPPPPPTAPGVPFAYLGKMIYDGRITVFLAYQDRNLAVKEGEVIDGTYRIDSIKGPVLTLTYLPLDAQQTMHIGEQN